MDRPVGFLRVHYSCFWIITNCAAKIPLAIAHSIHRTFLVCKHTHSMCPSRAPGHSWGFLHFARPEQAHKVFFAYRRRTRVFDYDAIRRSHTGILYACHLETVCSFLVCIGSHRLSTSLKVSDLCLYTLGLDDAQTSRNIVECIFLAMFYFATHAANKF